MRARREPVLNVPGSVAVVLLLLIVIQGGRQLLGPDADLRVLTWLAFVPVRLTALVDSSGVAGRLATWASGGADEARRAEIAGFFVHDVASPTPLTLLTYALLHGNWTHVGLNGIWLLAFGSPVARRFGSLRFVAFLAVTAVAGALTHWALYPFGAEPLVGASAAVSGCMGAALRFAFPKSDPEGDGSGQEAAQPLAAILRNRRALSFLVVWFVSNALFGVGSVSFGLSDQPVAWQAHVGGFLAGLLLFRLFDKAAAEPHVTPDDPTDTAPLAR